MNIPTPGAPHAHAPQGQPDPRAQVAALFAEAHKFFHERNRRRCAAALALAETTAKHHHLHREAAQFRQAITLLAQGRTPKLLARPLPPLI